MVAEYQYDAYGNHNIINHSDANIGDVNPFRYRGYYFDSETGYYYLNTRYYSPIIGRFISPDELSILDETKSQINGLNLYMYCGDNPVMYQDPSGSFFVSLFIAGIVLGAVIGAATSIIGQGITQGWNNINWGQVIFDSVLGGLGGAISFSGIGLFGSIVLNAGLGFVSSVGSDLISNNGDWSNVDWTKGIVMTVIGGIFGASPGAQNSKEILKNVFKNPSIRKGLTAITKASYRYMSHQISKVGLIGTRNLYMPMIKKGISHVLLKLFAQTAWSTLVYGIGYSLCSYYWDARISQLYA